MNLFTRFLNEETPYTGAELSAHWIAGKTGEFRSGIVAFIGPCNVETSEMVDLEDRFQNAHIQAATMLHFLGEWFEGDLNLAVARQRLFIAGFAELLKERLSADQAHKLVRDGNDLYFFNGKERAKLSVSIVTATPVSTLFHFGVNVDFTGAPVRAIGLKDLELDPREVAEATLKLWEKEWASMAKARCKVAAR